ncbi:MAG: diheme cytochrome c [Gammaproteobacteria bacterium]|nr:diheme cytochrome c [Gammaproteobacteria bacterium]MCF6259571.1 diheme cytochrome c [Gammaproteobacteria bacterium]
MDNSKSKTWSIVLTMGFTLGLIGISGMVLSDDDDDYEGNDRWSQSRLDVAPVDNAFYKEECGSCHFPYQPGLLPARSWQRLMGGLEDHFAENAELEAVDAEQLTAYLTENAADTSDYKRSRGISRSLAKDDAPLRISTTRYFKRKHHELPDRMVKDNPDVRSFSNCELCHERAAQGSYDEHQVKVPGYTDWDD